MNLGLSTCRPSGGTAAGLCTWLHVAPPNRPATRRAMGPSSARPLGGLRVWIGGGCRRTFRPRHGAAAPCQVAGPGFSAFLRSLIHGARPYGHILTQVAQATAAFGIDLGPLVPRMFELGARENGRGSASHGPWRARWSRSMKRGEVGPGQPRYFTFRWARFPPGRSLDAPRGKKARLP